MVRAPRARLAGVRRRPTRPSRPAPAPGIARHATESCRGTIAERTEIDGGAGLPASGSARPPARPPARAAWALPRRPPGAPAAHGVGTVAQPELGGVRLPRPRPTGPGHRRSAGARRSHADWDCDFRLVPHRVFAVASFRGLLSFRSFDEPGMYTIRDRIRFLRAVPNQKCSWYNLPNKSCNRVDGVPTGNRYANGRGIFLFRVRYYRVDVRQSWFKDAVCVS